MFSNDSNDDDDDVNDDAVNRTKYVVGRNDLKWEPNTEKSSATNERMGQ